MGYWVDVGPERADVVTSGRRWGFRGADWSWELSECLSGVSARISASE